MKRDDAKTKAAPSLIFETGNKSDSQIWLHFFLSSTYSAIFELWLQIKHIYHQYTLKNLKYILIL